MSDKRCPSEAELLSFVDADFPPERLARIERHLEICSACAEQVMALTQLTEDVAAPVAGPPLDVAEHVASVMKRLDQPVAKRRFVTFLAWGGALAAAAAALIGISQLQGNAPAPAEFAARGGPAEASLSRHIGVQLYGQKQVLAALPTGSHISTRTGLTAGLRNLGSEPAYLLFFAVDSRKAVHWIAPEYTSEGTNPEAIAIAPSSSEKILPSVALFDDLATGPLHVIAVISPTPLHVADVESLPASELSAERLLKRFPRSEVRQFLLEVRAP
jgi:predicted anti-sigma-YlaC factor YlaD